MNFKKFSSILYSQFNYDTLPFTHFKGTVSVILSDPPYKDGNARNTTWNLNLFKNVNDIVRLEKCLFL